MLTEKVKRFDRLLRQADDPRGRKLAQGLSLFFAYLDSWTLAMLALV
jgi:hypothetical protein